MEEKVFQYTASFPNLPKEFRFMLERLESLLRPILENKTTMVAPCYLVCHQSSCWEIPLLNF